MVTVSERQRRSTQDVVDAVGREIVLGRRYRPGDELTIEGVENDQEISRPMAREVLQALHAVRLVDLRPRVGASVRPMREWNVLHPAVIEWRLALASSERVWRSLTQLRSAVEPAAARLAARTAPPDVCRDLVVLAYELKDLGEADPFDRPVQQRYREVDEEFHRAVLAGSGNEMFACLAEPVVMALNHRIDRQFHGVPRTARPFPDRPQPVALWLHVFLAQAIEQGRERASEVLSRGIMAETLGEREDPVLWREVTQSVGEVALAGAERDAFRVAVGAGRGGATS